VTLAHLLDDYRRRWLFGKTVSEAAQKALRAIGTPEALAALEAWHKRQR
jgi:hypothetical protein